MPIEIRELQISITVNPQQAKEAARQSPESQQAKSGEKEKMQQIVDTVMDIINSKKER